MSEKNETINVKRKRYSKYTLCLGITLVIIGVLWYAIKQGLIPQIYIESWPQILLIIIGCMLIFKAFN